MLTFMLAALTGCMELQRGIKVKANGDVECYSVVYMTESDMKYIYNTPEEFYDALKDSIDDEFPIESFEKIEKSEGKKTWFGARASYVIDKDDVDEELDRMFSNYDVEYETSGFLVKKVTVTIHSNGKSLTSMFTDLVKKPEKELTSYINQTTKNEFTIDVPYVIVSTNGVKIGNTATWDVSDLDSMGGGDITMTVSYINLPVFLVIAGICLLILIIVIILLVRRHKKNKKAPAISDMLQQGAAEGLQNIAPAMPQLQDAKQNGSTEDHGRISSNPQEPKMDGQAPVAINQPQQDLGDVPQVCGLPAVGQLPKTENKEKEN